MIQWRNLNFDPVRYLKNYGWCFETREADRHEEAVGGGEKFFSQAEKRILQPAQRKIQFSIKKYSKRKHKQGKFIENKAELKSCATNNQPW